MNQGLPDYFSHIYLYMSEWIKACHTISHTYIYICQSGSRLARLFFTHLSIYVRVDQGLPGYFLMHLLYIAEWIMACRTISLTFPLYFIVDQGLPCYFSFIYLYISEWIKACQVYFSSIYFIFQSVSRPARLFLMHLPVYFRVDQGMPGYFAWIYLYISEWIKECMAISHAFIYFCNFVLYLHEWFIKWIE